MKGDAAAALRLTQALDMWEDGVGIMRENLHRRLPRASRRVVDRALAKWLAHQPMMRGDFALGSWPRRR